MTDAAGAAIEVAVGDLRFRVVPEPDARYGAFWPLLSSGEFEPATVAVLTSRLGPGTTFVDVGAWIGPFTLLAAALGARVVAYEPDPMAFASLVRNVALNPTLSSRIELHQRAVSARGGTLVLDGGVHGLGNGRSHLSGRATAGLAAATVATIGATALATVAAHAECTVLKIDIEGGEFAVVPRLARYLRAHRPTLLLSLHGRDPMEVLAGRLGWLRLLAVRLCDAPRRARLLWALRSYPTIQRSGHRRAVEWSTLSRWDRLALVVRAGETELLAGD